MARREVKAEDVKMDFIKPAQVFQNKGDKFAGIFVRSSPSTGEYGGTNYTFKVKDGSEKTMTANTLLEKLLGAAKPAAGEKVIITFGGMKQNENTGNSMRLFSVVVDDAAPAASAPKKPDYGDDEDAPF